MNGLDNTVMRVIDMEVLGGSFRVAVFTESLRDGDGSADSRFHGVYKGRACRIVREGEPPAAGDLPSPGAWFDVAVKIIELDAPPLDEPPVPGRPTSADLEDVVGGHIRGLLARDPDLPVEVYLGAARAPAENLWFGVFSHHGQSLSAVLKAIQEPSQGHSGAAVNNVITGVLSSGLKALFGMVTIKLAHTDIRLSNLLLAEPKASGRLVSELEAGVPRLVLVDFGYSRPILEAGPPARVQSVHQPPGTSPERATPVCLDDVFGLASCALVLGTTDGATAYLHNSGRRHTAHGCGNDPCRTSPRGPSLVDESSDVLDLDKSRVSVDGITTWRPGLDDRLKAVICGVVNAFNEPTNARVFEAAQAAIAAWDPTLGRLMLDRRGDYLGSPGVAPSPIPVAPGDAVTKLDDGEPVVEARRRPLLRLAAVLVVGAAVAGSWAVAPAGLRLLGVDWAHLPWLVWLPTAIGLLAGVLCVLVWPRAGVTVGRVVAAGVATAGFAAGSAGLLWAWQEASYRFLPAWPWDVANWTLMQWGSYALGLVVFLAALRAGLRRRRRGRAITDSTSVADGALSARPAVPPAGDRVEARDGGSRTGDVVNELDTGERSRKCD
ncbi:MAG: hypothetical protein LBS56_05235 [Propionibacteriaceae bacterium]|jgi:hypothetical protein|nr:hypothetical protein [Propionibacteriaceae bacterium]